MLSPTTPEEPILLLAGFGARTHVHVFVCVLRMYPYACLCPSECRGHLLAVQYHHLFLFFLNTGPH